MDWLDAPAKEEEICGHKVRKTIARGSYGRVMHLESGYALKQERFLDPYPTSSSLREVGILAAARHPNVLRARGAFIGCDGFHTDRLSIIMDLGQGDLRSRLRLLSEDDRKQIAVDILLGLDFLHEQGLIHRDLKPDNIIINNHDMAVIADFGLSARSAGSHEIQTFLYRAPEVLKKDSYTAAVDVWSFGCILYELINPNERPLFAGARSDAQLLHMQKSLKLPLVGNSDLQEMMRACLRLDPETRPSTRSLLKSFYPDYSLEDGEWLVAQIQPGWSERMLTDYMLQRQVPASLWSRLAMLMLYFSPQRLIEDVELITAINYIAAMTAEPIAVGVVQKIYSSGLNFSAKLAEACQELRFRIYPRVPEWSVIVNYLNGDLDEFETEEFERGYFHFAVRESADSPT